MQLKPSHAIGQLSEVEAEAVALRASGLTMVQVQIETGLNHSQAERAIMKATLTEGDVAAWEASGADLGSRAAAHRPIDGTPSTHGDLSWGVMGILAGVPESQVRSAFKAATAKKSQGLRINHGGRFYYGERGVPLYSGELRPTGTTIPAKADYEGAVKAAFGQRLGRLDRPRLATMAERYNINPKGKSAKALQNAIIKAAAAIAERNAEREAKLAEATAPKALNA